MNRIKAEQVDRAIDRLFPTIRAYPVKSVLYLCVIPLVMHPVAIYGTLGLMGIIQAPGQWGHDTLTFKQAMWALAPVVHFILLTIGSLGSNRLLFRRHADVTLAIRRWLFAWHAFSFCVLPPLAWAIYLHPLAEDEKLPGLPIAIAIFSSGFYLLALVPAIMFVNRILGRD